LLLLTTRSSFTRPGD
jgi:hypothetical protein